MESNSSLVTLKKCQLRVDLFLGGRGLGVSSIRVNCLQFLYIIVYSSFKINNFYLLGLLYEMFLIREHKPCLNIQSDSIKANLFT